MYQIGGTDLEGTHPATVAVTCFWPFPFPTPILSDTANAQHENLRTQNSEPLLQVYLIGGTDLEGNHLATVTGYDAVLEESANYTDMPQPRAHAAVATDGSTIYVRPFSSF